MAKLRIALLFGGVSSEHDVSLLSASSVIRNMPEDIEIIKIGITKKGRWLFFPGHVSEIEDGTWEQNPDCVPCILSPDRAHAGIVKITPDGDSTITKVDAVFPVLHGKNGEDGTVQGLCMLAGVPYVGCDMTASALCMDKDSSKILLEKAGVPVVPWRTLRMEDMDRFEDTQRMLEAEIGYPMFVKPSAAGSSVGVTKVNGPEELKKAVTLAFTHDYKVLCEKAVDCRELECAVLGNDRAEVSCVGEILPSAEFYDYEAKYLSGTSRLAIPAELSDQQSDFIRSTALKAYHALGCAGMARVDFLLDKPTGTIYLNELNTLPGFTSISMYPKLWGHCGLPYGELLQRLIELAIERAEQRNG